MKPVNYLFLLATFFTCSAAFAQQKNSKSVAAVQTGKETGAEIMDRLLRELTEEFYRYVKDETAQGADILKVDDSKRLIAYFNSNGDIRAKKEKLYGTGYSRPIVFERQANESERIAWLKSIPVPKSPEQALQADPRENEKYAEKTEQYAERMNKEAQQLINATKLAKTYQQGGDEAVKKMYEKEVDKNPVVAQMGGVKKMESMSAAEREEAARKMVSAQTGGLTPEQLQKMTPAQKQALAKKMAAAKMQTHADEATTAFTRELMVNESYRKRYEAMSTAEKQEEFKKFEERYYEGAPEVMAAAYRPQAKDNAALADAKEIGKINQFSTQLYEDLKAEIAPLDQLARQYEQKWIADLEVIMAWSSAAVAALPVVRDSEYGTRKEGIELVHFTQRQMTYMLGKDKIGKQRDLWEKYVRVHVNAFKKLDDFVAAYSGKTGLSDRMIWALAGLKVQGYEAILDVNRAAGSITNEAGSVQYEYNCGVLKDCKDPRQDKLSNR